MTAREQTQDFIPLSRFEYGAQIGWFALSGDSRNANTFTTCPDDHQCPKCGVKLQRRTIFHIMAPLPRDSAVGNRFYQPGALRVKKTLCGQPRTAHDNSFGWQPLPAGRFVPCPDCCALRNSHRVKVKSPLASVAERSDELGHVRTSDGAGSECYQSVRSAGMASTLGVTQ